MNTEQHVNAQLTYHFRAPPEQVFDAWLDSKTAGKWMFSSATGRIVCVEIDGRAGGWFYIVHRRDGEDVEYFGEYHEVDRPRRLVFTLSVEKYTLNFDRVTIEIVPLAGGCELTLTHTTNMTGDASRIKVSWGHALDRLAAIIGAWTLPATMQT